jgi:RNA polymerase sigma-70 factor (ECF subfamily)
LKEKISNSLKKIIEQAKGGNGKAMQTLYNEYSRAMFSTCMRMSNTREDAEDLLQESFIDAFQHLDTFAYEASFGTWLKRIVINRCINALKKKKIDFVLEANIEDANIDEEIDYTDINFQVNKINKAIMDLPNGYKVICSLYLLEGYDHKEIAQILNIHESTSKTQYMRAKKKLKQVLLEQQ